MRLFAIAKATVPKPILLVTHKCSIGQRGSRRVVAEANKFITLS